MITAQQCIDFACESYGITEKELLHGGRSAKVLWPRRMAMRLCRLYAGLSLVQIGKDFGCDHTTVIFALKQLQNAMDVSEYVDRDVGRIENSFSEKFGCSIVKPEDRNGYTPSRFSREEAKA